MKLTYRSLAVALSLALVAVTIAIGMPAEAFAAVHHDHSVIASLAGSLHDFTPYAAASLAALRADLDGLTKRAADKIAELKDDTPADQARAINDDHDKLVKEIEAKRAEIAAEEAAEAARNADGDNRPPVAGDNARSADILDIGTRAGMDTATIQEAIRSGTSLDDFRRRAFDHMVAATAGTRTEPGRVLRDEAETVRAARIEALSYRLGAAVPQAGPAENVRVRMRDGLIRLAMESVGERNYPETPREREALFERAAHTTSDFPIIMEGAVNRTLEARYRLAEPTFRRIARQRNFRDFRPHTTVKTGDFPMLKPIAEDGEIKFGTLTEGKEQLSVLSYAVGISVSRQLMINDDLGAINDMLSDYGATVALFEEITFYSQAFNGKLADGKTVFHADHGNLAAAPSGIDVDNVALGRAAMGKQKSLSGNPLLSNAPSLLLTGPDRITAAEKLVASITPATLANVNIFSGRLTPFSTSQIADLAWYLFADPAIGSNYRWGYLEGYEAPRVRIENPFGRQGMAMSVEHDFGCGATDYRYGFKNAGQ